MRQKKRAVLLVEGGFFDPHQGDRGWGHDRRVSRARDQIILKEGRRQKLFFTRRREGVAFGKRGGAPSAFQRGRFDPETRAESLEEQVENLYKRMERMEDERYAKEISRIFSQFMGGKCESEIVSNRKMLDRYIAEGCIILPTFEKNRYLVIRPGGETDG